jgi:hypothetical protein
MSALYSFTSYEPWTNKDIVPAIGRGRKRCMAVDQKGYLTCGSWEKTGMTFFLMKGTQLAVDENGYA